MNSPDRSATLAHYQAQAVLAGDATHVAALIRKHPSYMASELATLITALSCHADHMERVGLDRFGEVCELLDKAAGIAEDSFYNPELEGYVTRGARA